MRILHAKIDAVRRFKDLHFKARSIANPTKAESQLSCSMFAGYTAAIRGISTNHHAAAT